MTILRIQDYPNESYEETIYRCCVQEGILRIDDEGAVWRIRRYDPKIREYLECELYRADTHLSRNGYKRVRMRISGGLVSCQAHRLVALHFYGPLAEGYEVHHKNRCRWDNRPDNLEVVSPEEHEAQYRIIQQRHSDGRWIACWSSEERKFFHYGDVLDVGGVQTIVVDPFED